jgi:hypothetical protein
VKEKYDQKEPTREFGFEKERTSLREWRGRNKSGSRKSENKANKFHFLVIVVIFIPIKKHIIEDEVSKNIWWQTRSGL